MMINLRGHREEVPANLLFMVSVAEVEVFMHEIPFLGIDEGQPSFSELCLFDSRYEHYRTGFVKKSYPAGACIHSQGDKITHFGIVTSGILKAVSYSRDGSEMCHTYFEEMDSFPEFLYLTGERRYTYLLYVEKRAAVTWIPILELQEMLTSEPHMLSALLLYVSKRGLKNQLYLNCLNYQTIRERIAYWILGIQKMTSGKTVMIPRSQTILANMLHVSRASLNQELKQMEREGYFRLDKEKILGADAEKLMELL